MPAIQCDFVSEVLGLCTSMRVLLPAPRRDQPNGPYPTLWLLHGMSDDATIWHRRTAIERYVDPMRLAVVMPQVDRSFYTDMHQGPRYGTFIAEELPQIARGLFPLAAERERNFVAGLSMGGYGAFRLALTHPDRYAAAASLSGALDVAGVAEQDDPPRGEEWLRIFGPPAQVRGGDNDLFHLADRLVAGDAPRPRLYCWCGTDDFLYQANLRFRAHAAAIGLALTYEEGPGGHTWDRWDAGIRRVLTWLDLGVEPAV